MQAGKYRRLTDYYETDTAGKCAWNVLAAVHCGRQVISNGLVMVAQIMSSKQLAETDNPHFVRKGLLNIEWLLYGSSAHQGH
jgi:hypothetical protein